MKFLFSFILIFIFQIQHSLANRYDAHFLDRMLGLNEETSKMAELAQAKSENLDLKKIARIIIRENHREIKKLHDWRSTYFSSIPEHWVLPSKFLQKLTQLDGTDFDLQFLDVMIKSYDQGKSRLLEAGYLSDKDFIKTYSKKRIRQVETYLKYLTDLKHKIMAKD